MERLDLDPPAPTLWAWSRTARPVRFGRDRAMKSREAPPWTSRLDDILFGFSATTLLLIPLVVLPLAAWLR